MSVPTPPTNAQLKTELTTDPSALGYAALITAGAISALAQAINLVRAGGAFSVFRNDIAPIEVINAIASADFAASTALQMAQLQFFFAGGRIDATSANVRANFLAIFSAASTATKNALSALSQRQGSRAEVLWGTSTVIIEEQITNALNS